MNWRVNWPRLVMQRRIIESFVLDQTLASSQVQVDRILTRFSQDFPKVMQDVDFIEKKVMKIKGKMEVVKDQQPVSSLHADGLSRRLAPTANDTTTGLDSHLLQLKERLVGDEPKLQMVSIVGMGGIGKTTLVRTVYDHPLIVESFEIRAWVTISQEYDTREILLALLHVTEILFGEQLRKNLYGRRYLIVMDDMWSTKVWDEVRKYFPDTSNKSRILITTRLSNVAVNFDSDAPHEMDFLDDDKSWNLLCEKVFLGEACPLELEEIGKQIAKSCKGLPLALVVIGGLLAKSQRTIVQWNHLPIHLKPCFLYMATFPEDLVIRMSRLIKLWIGEGFINPIVPRSLEDIALEYLKEHIDRNLLIVQRQGALGKMKSCTIHDLLRDLCLREAHKENFLCITKVYDVDIPPNIENTRRLGIHRSTKQYRYNPQVLNTLRSASSTRSLVCESEWISPWLVPCLKLLRVLNVHDVYSPENVIQLVNSRYLHFTILPPNIWEMTQLRHLKFEKLVLPEPPQQSGRAGSQDSYILENLQTLSTLENFRFTKEVHNRIPNIKKMKIAYGNDLGGLKLSSYCLKNLSNLGKLESLTLNMMGWCEKHSAGDFGFPHSLKKLTLRGCRLPWEDMRFVGSLPKLEMLRLYDSACVGSMWNPSEGEFARLKLLQIRSTDLKYWGAENTHFPSLEHLALSFVYLQELPLALAEIHTLRSIELDHCKQSVVDSMEQIREERESLGYEHLHIQVSKERLWDGF
ncbi:putative late blight resistance proteinR1B-19 [Sesamum angolense]|uniref:Late blight resistance proteinR1B-19 n=1 Tax=Sesamum angolense TaxID=2727404 RepID=A0AAE1WL43_9LAMI|nr:putative late blight resistance proteinR1B-19 [Sesamum angolense]